MLSVMEHRGLLGALGVALFSLGTSLLIAYGTASYAKGGEFQWFSGYSRVGEALALSGVILLIMTVILICRQKWKINKLAQFTGSGNEIMGKLEVSITGIPSAVPIDDLNMQIIDWGQSVDRWCEKYLSQYGTHFRNRGGHVQLIWNEMPPEDVLNDATATYTVCMSMLSGHLLRLSEITMRL
jgi:hypothetical protein